MGCNGGGGWGVRRAHTCLKVCSLFVFAKAAKRGEQLTMADPSPSSQLLIGAEVKAQTAPSRMKRDEIMVDLFNL